VGLLGRLTAAALFLAVLSWVPAQAGAREGFAVIETGKGAVRARPAAELGLPGLDGKTIRLKDLEGRVVLLHFWASWCGPCKVEMPALKRLAGEFGDKGLSVLLVAEDSLKNARVYAEEHALGLPVLVDQYGRAMRGYGVKVIPTSVVIGRDGMVKAYIVGQRDYTSPGSFEFFGRMLGPGE